MPSVLVKYKESLKFLFLMISDAWKFSYMEWNKVFLEQPYHPLKYLQSFRLLCIAFQ